MSTLLFERHGAKPVPQAGGIEPVGDFVGFWYTLKFDSNLLRKKSLMRSNIDIVKFIISSIASLSFITPKNFWNLNSLLQDVNHLWIPIQVVQRWCILASWQAVGELAYLRHVSAVSGSSQHFLTTRAPPSFMCRCDISWESLTSSAHADDGSTVCKFVVRGSYGDCCLCECRLIVISIVNAVWIDLDSALEEGWRYFVVWIVLFCSKNHEQISKIWEHILIILKAEPVWFYYQ